MPSAIRCVHCKINVPAPESSATLRVRCPRCARMIAPAERRAASAEPVTPVEDSAPSPRPSLLLPEGFAPAVAPPVEALRSCPACKSALLPGAISCLDCGFLLQNEETTPELAGPPLICVHPDCGAANPAGERNCQRCG